MTSRISAVGLECPEPLKLLARAISESVETHFEIETTDPVARIDIPAWCHMRGLTYLGFEELSQSDVHRLSR